jgi:predicted RND superfamily exporter protein
VPKNIRETYQGKDGKYLTIAYPTEDPWEYGYQQIHLAQLNTLKDETATGSIQMIISFMEVAAREGARVLLYTVIFIYLILLVDFRSFKYATFAMLPMGLTLALTLGLMGWFNMTFNFVNILALPMIIGIGVDDGVHLIHRYLIENKLGPTIKSTGRAITLTTLTTIAAFGSMMLAAYRGFASFAFLLSIGIGLAYLTTMALLPALIVLFDKNPSTALGAKEIE